MKIYLFDRNQEVVDALKKHIPPGAVVDIQCTTAENIMREKPIDIVVCPGDSFGNLRDGLAGRFKELYPELQKKVKKRISDYPLSTLNGKSYTTIGSAIPVATAVPPGTHRARYVLWVPTMFMKQDISSTDNVYHAFYATIRWFARVKQRRPRLIMACPGLGTGVGGMSPDEAARQMAKAIHDLTKGLSQPEGIIQDDHNGFVLEKVPCLQPDSKANRQMPGQRGHRRRRDEAEAKKAKDAAAAQDSPN